MDKIITTTTKPTTTIGKTCHLTFKHSLLIAHMLYGLIAVVVSLHDLCPASDSVIYRIHHVSIEYEVHVTALSIAQTRVIQQLVYKNHVMRKTQKQNYSTA